MKMLILFLSLFIVSITPSLADCASNDADSRVVVYEGKSAPLDTYAPFMRILVRPEDFAGKRVLLFGVLAEEPDGFAVYADEESMRFKVQLNALFLDLTSEQKAIACRNDGKYILIQGTIVQHVSPYTLNYVGTITNVTRIRPLTPRESRQRQ